MGVARRAAFFAMLSWLPSAVWALLNHRLLDAAAGEPLLVPIALPMLAVVAQRIPVREVLSKLVGVLL